MTQISKKILFFAFILVFICIAPFSVLHAEGDDGSSNIKGMITTSEGSAAAGVIVLLKGTKKNAITDEDGFFYFKNIPAGNYQIEVSLTNCSFTAHYRFLYLVGKET